MLSDSGVAKTYRELEAWQLAVRLRQEVFALTAQGPVTRDRKFCDQVRDSSASVARNIAEGFGRYSPGEFARFVTIARGSLDETDDHLRRGVECSYYPAGKAGPIILLLSRCRSALEALHAYLRRPSTKSRFGR